MVEISVLGLRQKKKKKSKQYSEENTICSADLMHAKQNSVTYHLFMVLPVDTIKLYCLKT